MTSLTDICNQALQNIGTRTTVTDAELATNDSNEAIQFNISYANTRDDLLRLAPWDHSMKTANLVYVSSVPGTPENTSPATNLWQPGQPAPPWAYEYQYPVDCLRACWIIPGTQTGFASGIPITTAVTGGAPSFWWGRPVKFKVQNDQFYPVTAAAVQAGGSGYAIGDVITLASGPNSSPPIGAPVQLVVLTLGVGNSVGTVEVVNQINGSATPQGGSYFAKQTNPVAQGSTTGLGVGATFNLTFGPKSSQRVILTNQEFATLSYVMQSTDPNLWDSLFQSALITAMGAMLAIPLVGDKKLWEQRVADTNKIIAEARSIDGNEGLTTNDVTPDFLRIRGVDWTDGYTSGPYSAFDWGGWWTGY